MLFDLLINNFSLSSLIGVVSLGVFSIYPHENPLMSIFIVQSLLLVFITSAMERHAIRMSTNQTVSYKRRFPFISVIILLALSYLWQVNDIKSLLFFSIFQLVWTIGVYVEWILVYKKHFRKNYKD